MNSKLSISEYIPPRAVLIAAGAAVALVAAARSLHAAAQLPPGPWGLPLLGRLPFIDARHFEESEEAMRQKYGPIFSFRAGQRLMICVASSEAMREMLREDVFSGRLVPPSAAELAAGCGIIFTEGRTWSEQRRVCLRVLRDFGFARSASVEKINEEMDDLLSRIEQKPRGVNTHLAFLALSNSVIASLLFGRRYANEDPRFEKFLEDLSTLATDSLSASMTLLLPTFSPLLRLVPQEKAVEASVKSMENFICEEIAYRESQLTDADAESLCLCDAYIQERRRAEAKGDFESHKPFNLVRVCVEMFVAGTDTTSRSLEWLLLYMSLHPDVQAKVQQEIDRVVGRQRRPNLSDRAELHYTQAVIDEGLRFASLAFNGVPHRAVRATSFRGFRIPDDAVIVPFVFGAHRDASVWQRPDEFWPQHFLDSQGRYAPSKNLVPFGVGKRSCPGESLAMLEMFLAFSAVMQRFSVQLSPEFRQQVPGILRGDAGTIRVAGEHTIDFELR